MAEILKWRGGSPCPASIAKAARVIRSGGLLVAPTESVYVILARADNPETLSKLRDLKHREKDKPFARLDPDFIPLLDSFPARTVRKLANRFWPGPLIMVIPLHGSDVGIRIPRPIALRQLLMTAGCQVIATRANLADQSPATDAKEAIADFRNKVDMILDGGPTEIGTVSTVVKISETGKVEAVLREGALTERQIRDGAAMKIVFVCTGNTCRSPAAAALARHFMAKKLSVSQDELVERGFVFDSAGLSSYHGAPMSAGSAAALTAMNVFVPDHGAKTLAQSLLAEADRVLVMTEGHAQAIANRFPNEQNKVQLLDKKGIADPFGGTSEDYQLAIQQISDAVSSLVDRLATD